ncbi:MAG TPA: type VI secretion system tip protein TssI/VgrG [Bryobacteraceae bacterium]|nr:type VI secretion system tip protein TssI/VgrG [Bryobacteraceae bacterium]
MPTYTQTDKPMIVTTPLGQDTLLLTDFSGHEGISQLFGFRLDLLAKLGTEIHFDKILGESVTVELRLLNGDKRYFNGLVKRFSQGVRDETFVSFRAEVVPKLWLLTKKVRCRIFQHLSVPDILREVLTGLDVSYQISGTYYARDYCVQYRESDFDFVSRLMEEEGIYYFFKHADGKHQMVVTDIKNPTVEGQSTVVYEELFGGLREDMRITNWEKAQELRAGEYTLWDHCFELPGQHLEAKRKTVDSVTVGKVTHKLNVGGNDQLEIYDYPGGYAQRFDGIDPNAAPRPRDLKLIFEDRDRTVRIRMEQEDVACLEIRGASNCGNFAAGNKFTLDRHFDADGQYVLTYVNHRAHQAGYRSNETPAFQYENQFTCIPAGLRYRPQRATVKPVIAGVQTATVVGPQGEEIFCDKYGRVKVQFHWDREGKKDTGSSCWLRVAQVWAGKGWGAFFWPRIGHEVVVTFEEGDPDQPLIVGSVYNAENMPWFELPLHRQLAGFKSASVHGTAQKNYNGIVFNDHKGHEHLAIHSERNLSLNSEYDKMIHAGRHKGEHVSVANMLTVGNLVPGGGSGGSIYGLGFDNADPMPEPPPTGVLGLNSVMVYGENVQGVMGMSHQLTVGNNVQICVNPGGLAEGVPGVPGMQVVEGVLGSGLGGNMQFTLGSSVQFTLGQSIELSVGPPKIEFHDWYRDHFWATLFSGLLGVSTIVWETVYAAETADHTRATLTMVFKALTDVLLGAVMTAAMFEKWTDEDTKKKVEALHKLNEETEHRDWWEPVDLVACGFVATASILGPILAIGLENNDDAQPVYQGSQPGPIKNGNQG